MINFLMLMGACCLPLGYALETINANNNYIETSEKVELKTTKKNYASYDDEDHYITLTNEELTYSYENLYQIFEDEVNGFCTFSYTSDDIEVFDDYALNSYQEFGDGSYFFNTGVSDTSNKLIFVFDNEDFNNVFDTEINKNYVFLYNKQLLNTNGFFTINYYYNNGSENGWNAIKSAIEADIQANSASDNMIQVVSDFLQVMISGISDMATGIANGVVSMAQALFLETSEGSVTGLSVFGGIIAMFAGLALAVALTSKVYTWITTLGH